MNKNADNQKSLTVSRTMPIGRILRFILGVLLIGIVVPRFIALDLVADIKIIGIVIAIIVFYMLLHAIVYKFLPGINRWLGAILALTPVILVFIFGGFFAKIAVLTFLGVSLIIASIRADSGCEVMSIPGLFFSKRTHLVCIVFSPLDWIEKRIFKRSP